MTDIHNSDNNPGGNSDSTADYNPDLSTETAADTARADAGDPRVDTPIDLADRVTYLTVLLRRKEMLRRHGHAGGFGRSFGGEIRSGQGRVLGILALQSPLTQKNLAYMLDVRPQSLSELVAKLESKGLVTRQRDDNDRRSYLIELTDTGREAAEQIDALTAEDPFDILTIDERAEFTTLVDKVISSVEDAYPDLRGHGDRGRRSEWNGRGRWGGWGDSREQRDPREHRDHREFRGHGGGPDPRHHGRDRNEWTDEDHLDPACNLEHTSWRERLREVHREMGRDMRREFRREFFHRHGDTPLNRGMNPGFA